MFAKEAMSIGNGASCRNKNSSKKARMDTKVVKMIDIGANLSDDMFKSDLDQALERGKNHGVEKILVTAGSLSDLQKTMEIVKSREGLFTTIGVHPTNAAQFDQHAGGFDGYLQELIQLYQTNPEKVVAIGEFGLDYQRLEFCSKEIQIKYFKAQFQLTKTAPLPLFLHLRDAAVDFIQIIKDHRADFTHGVVHSFDGTKEELEQLLELDLFIGINGCSLKTEQNLEVAKLIPLDRLMIETDAPWCQIRPSHASNKYIKTKFTAKDKKKATEADIKKGRNEICYLIQVAEVLAAIRSIPLQELLEAVYQNTDKVFFPQK